MKTFLKKIAGVLPVVGLVLVAAAGCTKSGGESGGEPGPETELVSLNVQLSDAGFHSGSGSLYASRFENGDKAGVFLVKDGSAVLDNAAASYDGTAWKVDGTVEVAGDEKCYIYFPYRSDVSSLVDISASSAEEFFAPMRSWLSNVMSNVKDQSERDAVKPFDIMSAAASTEKKDGVLSISADLEHMLALATWSLSDGVSYKTSDGFSYCTPSSYTDVIVSLSGREVKPFSLSSLKGFYYMPGTAGGQLSITYKDGDKDGEFTVALEGAAGTVSTVAGGNGTDGGVRDLAAGDLYYSDGSIIPVETAAAFEDGGAPAGVAGVIFQTDKSRFSETEKALLGDVHALVVSAKMPVYNGSADVKWFDDYPSGTDDGNRNESIEDPAYPGLYLPFIGGDGKTLASSLNADKADIDGYRNTHVIWTRRAEDMAKGWYEVFSAVNDFSVSIPSSGTSGWYLPSIGQLLDMYVGLGKADVTADHLIEFMGVEDYTVSPEYAPDLKNVMDASLMKINARERDLFSASDALWSSSHSKTISSYTQSDAFCARQTVTTDGALSVISYQTFGNNTQSRAVLSF